MEKKSVDFLLTLLETPSPSGDEKAFQKIWLERVKKFAEVDTDMAGNAIGILNKNADFKVLLAGHCDEIGMVVTSIDENGFVYFTKSGGIDHTILPGLEVEIFGESEKIDGVIGFSRTPEFKIPEKISMEDLHIDCGAIDSKSVKKLKKQIKIGDYILYKSSPKLSKDGIVTGKGLDNKTGAFIVSEVLRKLSKKKLKVGVYCVSTTGEETNLRGAYFAGSGLNPSLALACDVTFATDTPGMCHKKFAKIELGKGPTLSKGSPINPEVNKLLEKAAKKAKIATQYELTPEQTCTDADKIHFSGNGVPVAIVSLPLRYMHSPIEMASIKDIENEIDMLVEFISGLTGKEDLRPVKP